MNECLVSICISVYNGEKYLRRCLDSVLSQNISSMEIVLVNDGSTDSSSEIMYEYQARYPGTRIKVIEQENRGLAQGRWTGVKNSCGRYITFLDVDDYLLNDAYKTKLDAIIKTLGLNCSRKELERYISQNVTQNTTFNRVIHLFGLRNGYRICSLNRILSNTVIRRVCNGAARIDRKIKYRADMVFHPKETRWFCPCCNLKFREFKSGHFLQCPERYNPERYINTYQNVLCPNCGSLPRHRILASWCEKHKELLRTSKILYFAPEPSMMMWMNRNGVKCTTADMFHKAELTLDIQKTGLADESYSLIIANHVLEHVDDSRKALKEVYRILKPGGIFICSFPMDPNVEIMDEDPCVQTDEERYFRYGQIDHKRVFGVKADQLIVEAGFSVEAIKGDHFSEDILPVIGPADYDMNCLFCCKKTRMDK